MATALELLLRQAEVARANAPEWFPRRSTSRVGRSVGRDNQDARFIPLHGHDAASSRCGEPDRDDRGDDEERAAGNVEETLSHSFPPFDQQLDQLTQHAYARNRTTTVSGPDRSLRAHES